MDLGLFAFFFFFLVILILSYFIFDLQMFDRIKPSDEASASSVQGETFQVYAFIAGFFLM